MFTELKIDALFGNFNYRIKLKEDGVTIITGPNGFGKSTILRIIEAIFKGDIAFFFRLDYKKITVLNKSLIELEIRKNGENLIVNDEIIDVEFLLIRLSRITRRRPYYRRISENKWIDRRTDEEINLMDLIQFLNGDLFTRELDDNGDFENEEFCKITNLRDKMKEVSGEIRFIKEQRLIIEKLENGNEKKLISTIDELPNNFKQIMNQVSKEYSATANKLDSTYPNRLFATSKGITKEDYSVKMQILSMKFEKLARYDISDIRLPRNVEFMEEHAKALKVYFDDFEKKYEVFEPIITKLEMFTEIVNDRLKFKEVKISREKGIEVFKNRNMNKSLELSQLSSGEKQEIVLFYELIFKIDHNVHLLIDEPEISLHIEWQLKFMDDLLRIAKYKKLRVTVATHSPQIINDHWDIQVDLGEMYGA